MPLAVCKSEYHPPPQNLGHSRILIITKVIITRVNGVHQTLTIDTIAQDTFAQKRRLRNAVLCRGALLLLDFFLVITKATGKALGTGTERTLAEHTSAIRWRTGKTVAGSVALLVVCDTMAFRIIAMAHCWTVIIKVVIIVIIVTITVCNFNEQSNR